MTQPLASAPVVRDSATAYKALQTLAAGLLLILAAGILQIGAGPYIAFAYCGSLLVFVSGDRSKGGFLKCAALGLAFAAIYHFSHGRTASFFGSQAAIPCGFLGMGAFQLTGSRWIWASAANQRGAFTEMMRCALIPFLCMGSMISVGLAAQLIPITYDPVVFAFDVHLDPAAPSWRLGAFLRAHSRLLWLCGYVYNSLPLALSACLALQWRGRPGQFPVNLGILFVTLGVAGFGLYLICPVSGPAYLFPHDYPVHLPALSSPAPAPLAIVPRNGMPSLHVAWTFLLFWNLRKRWFLGPLAGVFLILTALATLGFGEHYLADLIVAIPLALTVQCAVLESGNKWRWAALSAGGVLTMAWLVAFRTLAVLSLPSGAAFWAIVAATLLLPAVLAWRSEGGGLPRAEFVRHRELLLRCESLPQSQEKY